MTTNPTSNRLGTVLGGVCQTLKSTWSARLNSVLNTVLTDCGYFPREHLPPLLHLALTANLNLRLHHFFPSELRLQNSLLASRSGRTVL